MNYYEILEIKEDASVEVIKAAYKALVKKYHPDENRINSQDRERNINNINEAYEVLSDERKRKEYDETLLRQKNEQGSKESVNDKDSVTRFWELSESVDDALFKGIMEVGEKIINIIRK